jgi:hypothetical protein
VNRRDRDEKCALCDEYSVREAEPEFADVGMGRCMARDPKGFLSPHVAWNAETCISYRIDRPNLGKRRQYIAIQQQKETPP